MKRAIITAILAAAFIILALPAYAQQEIQIANGYKIILSKEYQNDKYLSYPGSATYSDKKSNITLASQKLDKKSADIDKQREVITKQLKMSRFDVTESKTIKINDNPAFVLKYSMNKGKAQFCQYGIIADNSMYIMTCATSKSLMGKYAPEFQKAAESFSK